MSTVRIFAQPMVPKVKFDAIGLIWTITRTDFKSRYHGSFGGFAWALLKPTAMFVVLYGVFSFVFITEPFYKLKLILGLFLFDFFAESTKVGLTSLCAKGYLLTKAKFPLWIVVATSVSNALITLGVFTIALFVMLAIGGHAPHPVGILLYLFYVAALMAIAVGISLGGSVLFLRYRDLNQVWDVMIQAGFFLAPIVYPLGVIPHRFQFYVYLWPPTPVIQFARAVLVDGNVPSWRAHALLVLMAGAIFGAGVLTFRRHASRAAEYL